MAHTDGPAFLPVINTVTLGSHAVLELYDPVDVEVSLWKRNFSLEMRVLSNVKNRSVVVLE